MGRTACTEPQSLCNGVLYLYLRVALYLYSPYGPYGLYRASVPVQGCTLPLPYSRAIPLLPPVGHTACTEPQCLTFLFLFSPRHSINNQQPNQPTKFQPNQPRLVAKSEAAMAKPEIWDDTDIHFPPPNVSRQSPN
jgi:hypothetical protein